MTYKTDNYKLLSFVMLLKSVRSNSMFYGHEKKYSFITSQGIKISPATFKKYWDMAEEKGYIQKMGEHFQLRNEEYIALDLKIDYFIHLKKKKRNKGVDKYLIVKGFRDVIFKFSKEFGANSFKGMYDSVMAAAQFFEFGGQYREMCQKAPEMEVYHKLSSDKNLSPADSKMVKNIMKRAQKSGKSLKAYSSCMLKKLEGDQQIKFGNRFYGKVLGISPSKSSKVFKSLVRLDLVRGVTEYKNLGEIPKGLSYEQAMGFMNELGKKPVIVSESSNLMFNIIGTKVYPRPSFYSLFDSSSSYSFKSPSNLSVSSPFYKVGLLKSYRKD